MEQAAAKKKAEALARQQAAIKTPKPVAGDKIHKGAVGNTFTYTGKTFGSGVKNISAPVSSPAPVSGPVNQTVNTNTPTTPTTSQTAPVNNTSGQISNQTADNGVAFDPDAEAKSLVEGGYQESQAFLAGLDPESAKNMPTTIQGVYDKLQDEQKKQLEYSQTQSGLQNEIEQSQFDIQKKQGESVTSGMEATMAQGREGVMSASKPLVAQQFKNVTNEMLDNSQKALTMAQNQRAEAERRLIEAQNSGDSELASALQGQIASANQKIRESQTQLANSLAQQLSVQNAAEASQRANITTFTGMVDNGTVMDLATLQGMSSQMNIPMELASSYYDGAEMIRNDKQMDSVEKGIKLQDLQNEFDDKVNGIRTEEAKKIDDYMTLSKSGQYSEAEMAQFATLMGIPNDKNPIFQNQLTISALDAQIKQYEFDNLGMPPKEGTMERLEYDKLKLEMEIAKRTDAESRGTSGAFDMSEIPSNELLNAIGLTGASKYGHGEAKRECGEAHNDFTTGDRTMGSLYKDKMDDVTKTDNPEQGNALVLPLTSGGVLKYGHVETVLDYNQGSDVVTTISYNRDLHGTPEIRTYKVSDLQSKYGDNWGFTDSKLKPEYANSLNKIVDEYTPEPVELEYSSMQKSVMNSLDPSKLSSTDMKVLEQNGLTSGDLASYIESEPDMTPEVSEMGQLAHNSAVDLMSKFTSGSGTSAVGMSGMFGSFGYGLVPGTERADFINSFDSLKSQLSLDAIKYIKGQGTITDGERQMLSQSVTKLNLDQSEEEFEKTLQVIIDKLSGTPEIDPNDPDHEQKQADLLWSQVSYASEFTPDEQSDIESLWLN